ncbi:hypothetical protein [Candidatus Poriferisodalis sp.]|uniref:hypothetical protein n=1 Tax=Candidatus Poriferisodalis sp. TaxID=3101277 RepID=UPI003B02EC18
MSVRPDDDYLVALGWAKYAFLHLEWLVIYTLHDETGRTVTSLSKLTPRTLSNLLAERWGHDSDLSALAERYSEIVSRREDIAHSHPATQQISETGESLQRLRRHKPNLQAESSRVYWITTEWLERFAADALTLNRNISEALGRR